ncbi:hypothetical protein HRbin22_01078 [Candidatus Thermoflexus japonica]|uniref:DUF3291 domain-containing protein n=1 Tax=Candidatus Thermoflexus japonica TaxID=2035417 RepID=A0A2H5Y5W3_9CHLR|nr:hypothetical protein HRbin22_01078 [Candidatus Thermoflexus japonica]
MRTSLPSSRRIPGGPHQVRAPVRCVLTRCRLRHAWDIIFVYRDFRQVFRQLKSTGIPGFLGAVFLIENLHTVYFLSFWDSLLTIARFGSAVPAHVEAVRQIFRRAARTPDGQPEVWSTQWELHTVSNNLNWQGMDWWVVLATAEARSIDEADTRSPSGEDRPWIRSP